MAIAILASSGAPGGTGHTRLSRSSPRCRSMAMVTPKPNMAAPITPKTP